jgi:predicted lipoprotein
MIKKTHVYSLFLAAVLLTVAACDKPKPNDKTDSFDKQSMLSNIGENLIVVSYGKMRRETDSLDARRASFLKAPNAKNLAELQEQFLKAYVQYQSVSTYEVGPADAELYRANLNTFPCDTAQIRSKIANGDFSISAADIDAKGFPAIDYLLFDVQLNNNTVLKRFTSDANAENALNYLSILISEIAQKTRTIHSGWSASGENYLSVFSSNTGSNTGSSIGMLVNQFCFDLEILKNASIGIPAGKRSLGTLFPEKTEGYYSGSSLTLAKMHLKNLDDLYHGNSTVKDNGIGFDDYLIHIGAMYGNSPLNEVITAKFKAAKEKLDLVPETLAKSLTTHSAAIDAAYNELQQLVVLLKVDMTSSLGIQITYQDNDGD